MATGFFNKYRKAITTAAITLCITAFIPSLLWLHDAYADDRYLSKEDSLRFQINQIDYKLFEIDQEIVFAETSKDEKKAEALRKYFLREKEALKELLDE